MRERVEAMKAIWTAGRGELPGELRLVRARSGRSRSRRSARTRRCWSAATARRCSTGCSPSATAGCPTTPATSVLERIAELRARAERPIDVDVFSAGRPARRSSASRDAGARRAMHWLPSGGRAHRRARARALGGGDRRAQRRVTAREARRRFAAAPASRGSRPPTRRGRPHLVPIVFALVGEMIYSAVDAQAQAHARAAPARQHRRQPARRRARRPLRGGLGAGCGGCAPTAAARDPRRRGAEAPRALDAARAPLSRLPRRSARRPGARDRRRALVGLVIRTRRRLTGVRRETVWPAWRANALRLLLRTHRQERAGRGGHERRATDRRLRACSGGAQAQHAGGPSRERSSRSCRTPKR